MFLIGTYATVYKGKSHLLNGYIALKEIRLEQEEGMLINNSLGDVSKGGGGQSKSTFYPLRLPLPSRHVPEFTRNCFFDLMSDQST